VANFTTLVELQLQLRKMVVEEPTLATLGTGNVPRDRTGRDSRLLLQPDASEPVRNCLVQPSHGQLPHDLFRLVGGEHDCSRPAPAFRTMWQSDRTKILHAGFRQYMNTLLEDASVCAPVPPGRRPIVLTSAVELRSWSSAWGPAISTRSYEYA